MSTGNDLRQEVSNHLLGDAVEHSYITEADIASNKMVPDLEMAHVAKSSRVGRDVQTSHRVRVHAIRLGARVPQKTHHVLSVDELLTGNAGGHKFGGARGVDHDGLL